MILKNLLQGIFGETYQVDEQIGVGGFGAVRAGTRKNDGTPVAFKYVDSSEFKTRYTIVSSLKLIQSSENARAFKVNISLQKQHAFFVHERLHDFYQQILYCKFYNV